MIGPELRNSNFWEIIIWFEFIKEICSIEILPKKLYFVCNFHQKPSYSERNLARGTDRISISIEFKISEFDRELGGGPPDRRHRITSHRSQLLGARSLLDDGMLGQNLYIH